MNVCSEIDIALLYYYHCRLHTPARTRWLHVQLGGVYISVVML